MDDAAKRLIYERNGVAAPRSGRTGFSGSMSDPEAMRIIAARNGIALGSGSSALTAEDAQLLARMQTNRQARAVLGAVAQILHQGYTVAEQSSGGPLLYFSNRALKAQFKSSLDEVNRWATKTYAGIPNDDAPLSAQNRQRVEAALAQARSTFAEVQADADWLNRGLTGAITDLLVAPWLPKNTPFGVQKWLMIGGVIVVGVVVIGVASRLVQKIAFGEANALVEAEEAAVAIAEAKRRKTRSRRVLSIS